MESSGRPALPACCPSACHGPPHPQPAFLCSSNPTMQPVSSHPLFQLDGFLENMLRSRISRRVMAEQHINLNNQRPGYIGA